MFNDGDNKEGWIMFEINPLNDIGVSVFEEEREETFTDIFDIVRGEGIEDGEGEKTVKEVEE
jgi:hypothetical protein